MAEEGGAAQGMDEVDPAKEVAALCYACVGASGGEGGEEEEAVSAGAELSTRHRAPTVYV